MSNGNPFFETWSTPFGIPPFDRIRAEHFLPAFEKGLAEHQAEIDAIADAADEPSFDNCIVALEKAGELLTRVSGVFWNLSGSNADEAIQAIERDISPKLAAHGAAVGMNQKLFARIDRLWERHATLGLDDEAARVLELTWKSFIHSGAKLGPEDRKRMGEIAERLATLGTEFSQNVLKDESDYVLFLDAGDLAGLPEAVKGAAAELARQRGKPGQFAFTTSRSSVEPFLVFSDRRDLRETLFKAWTARGDTGGPTDNKAVIVETLALRDEKAHLLGFKSFAHYKLDDTMAETPEAVDTLLGRVWPAGRARAAREAAELQKMIGAEGGNFALAAHDWRHYSEKRRRAEYAIDDTQLRPYFPLDRMIAAAFDVAHRLFGLSFEEKTGLPLYHPEVRTFEVKNAAGEHVALFLGDYFARSTKRSGAWMSAFRSQHNLEKRQRPIIVNVMNLVKPAPGAQALLSIDEARTLFHEFGHALHGMLSDVTYPSIAGTSVPTDFVELPSQLFEHWLTTPAVLGEFARHVDTGEVIPTDLVTKLQAARTFNQGFATVEYTASALVDMELHAKSQGQFDVAGFERDALNRLGMPAEIVMRHRTPHFSHIFSGEHYAAGYYSYLWSEVLDADAFRAFEETGDVFDPVIAKRLHDFIYSAGSRRDPASAYIAFRGKLPGVEALLAKRGLLEA